MKIAFYFSGRVTSKNFSNFLKKIKSHHYFNDIIFFASINEKKEIANKDEFLHEFCKELNITSPDQLYIEPTPTEKPTLLKKQKVLNPFGNNIDNVYSMHYHNQKCIELIENFANKYNIAFDAIVRFRSDVDFESNLDIFKYYPFEKNTVYIPTCRWKIRQFDCDDLIAVGDFESLKKYSSLEKYILQYCIDEKKSIHPESILKYHLNCSNIQVKPLDFKYGLNSSTYIEISKQKQRIKKQNIFKALFSCTTIVFILSVALSFLIRKKEQEQKMLFFEIKILLILILISIGVIFLNLQKMYSAQKSVQVCILITGIFQIVSALFLMIPHFSFVILSSLLLYTSFIYMLYTLTTSF